MPSTAHRAHECAICRRSFLAGETVRLYRDHPSRAAVRVCELCPTTAEARGWMPAESTGRHLRMPADPGRLELAERRDALVERLTGQLATLEEELAQARGVREEADAAQAALSAAHGEIDRLTARLASTRNELEAVLAARHKEAEERRELKAALSAAQDGAPVAPDAGDLKPGNQLGVDLGYRYDVSDALGLNLQLNYIYKGRSKGSEAEPEDSGSRTGRARGNHLRFHACRRGLR